MLKASTAGTARAVEDLERIRPYEPNITKAAWTIFGDSYRYRQAYNEYKRMRRAQEQGFEDFMPLCK